MEQTESQTVLSIVHQFHARQQCLTTCAKNNSRRGQAYGTCQVLPMSPWRRCSLCRVEQQHGLSSPWAANVARVANRYHHKTVVGSHHHHCAHLLPSRWHRRTATFDFTTDRQQSCRHFFLQHLYMLPPPFIFVRAFSHVDSLLFLCPPLPCICTTVLRAIFPNRTIHGG